VTVLKWSYRNIADDNGITGGDVDSVRRIATSGALDVFRARPFRTLTLFKRDGLSLSQFVKPNASARRLMKKVLLAIGRRDETKALTCQRLDYAADRRHVVSWCAPSRPGFGCAFGANSES
jgi:hypothetical protein